MSIRPRIRELAGYDFRARPGGVKLDQNELPFDLPGDLRHELLERIAQSTFNRYPEIDAASLRERLAQAYGWESDGVVVGPGSNVLIRCLVIAAGIGQTVLTPSPTFGVYRQQAMMLDAELVEVPMESDFHLPVEAMLAAMEGRRGLVFVANPAAPTGNLHSAEEIERLARQAGDRWTLVIDEAYCQFAGSDFREFARRPGIVSLRTLSKGFGLAGARVGFALAQPDLARQIRKTLLPFCVSELQHAAARTLLDHPEVIDDHVSRVRSERDRVQGALQGIPGVEAFPSVTNFILFRVGDAAAWYEALLQGGVVVRKQQMAGLEGCLRVTVGTREENDAFLAAMREAAEEVGNREIG